MNFNGSLLEPNKQKDRVKSVIHVQVPFEFSPKSNFHFQPTNNINILIVFWWMKTASFSK